jgi:hypothetical protein
LPPEHLEGQVHEEAADGHDPDRNHRDGGAGLGSSDRSRPRRTEHRPALARERDFRRQEYRRQEMRRDRDIERRGYYREQRFRDEDRGYGRRDYRY